MADVWLMHMWDGPCGDVLLGTAGLLASQPSYQTMSKLYTEKRLNPVVRQLEVQPLSGNDLSESELPSSRAFFIIAIL